MFSCLYKLIRIQVQHHFLKIQKRRRPGLHRLLLQGRGDYYSVFVISVLFLILSKGFVFGDTRQTDRRTDTIFFGRQSKEALLVNQGKPSSNLTSRFDTSWVCSAHMCEFRFLREYVRKLLLYKSQKIGHWLDTECSQLFSVAIVLYSG